MKTNHTALQPRASFRGGTRSIEKEALQKEFKQTIDTKTAYQARLTQLYSTREWIDEWSERAERGSIQIPLDDFLIEKMEHSEHVFRQHLEILEENLRFIKRMLREATI